jgi:2-desacetyl-2-hydroxyethyl bacteriochlorophyllide A dehydrogenase
MSSVAAMVETTCPLKWRSNEAVRVPDSSTPPPVLRRAAGQIVMTRALWYVKPGEAELRLDRLNAPRPDEVRVKTAYSAISRGTERLVASGNVPKSEWPRMRAPLQAGDFPFPVKYGYAAVGRVTAGPDDLTNKRVIVLHPHQEVFHAPSTMAVPIPNHIPDRRATLAANMETALNAHWDAGTGPSDRVLIVGGGIVGLLVAFLAKRIAGNDVTLIDIDPTVQNYTSALGVKFALPAHAPQDANIIFHTSATGAGLQTAIDHAAFEATIIEMSWYGSKPVTLDLGGAFHSRRLKLISSQVGHVAQSRRAAMTHRQRLEAALNLLDDPCLDVLVSDEIAFEDLPSELPKIWQRGGLPPIVRYT